MEAFKLLFFFCEVSAWLAREESQQLRPNTRSRLNVSPPSGFTVKQQRAEQQFMVVLW